MAKGRKHRIPNPFSPRHGRNCLTVAAEIGSGAVFVFFGSRAVLQKFQKSALTRRAVLCCGSGACAVGTAGCRKVSAWYARTRKSRFSPKLTPERARC